MTSYQENFIKNMKLYRANSKISQAQLAERCNVSNGTIGNIECGITKPSFDMLFSIADALNISVEQLFINTQYKNPINQPASFKLSKEQILYVKETLNTAIENAVKDL